MIKRYFFIAIVLFLASCETFIEIELPTEAVQVTVNSVLNADSTVTVNLTKSRASGTQGSVYEKIPNAEVSFYKNSKKLAQLQYVGSGNYRLTGLTPGEPGALYGVKVNVPGFNTVEADDIMLKKPLISGITTPTYVNSDFLVKDFKISVTVDDTPEDNFYLIRAFLISPTSKGIVYMQVNNNLGQFSPIENREISLFTDKLFNGKSLKLELEISSLLVSKGPHSILIELANISRAYYDYEFTVKKQLGNDPIFGQEYLPVTNNIKNGLGIFASYNSTIFSFEVKR